MPMTTKTAPMPRTAEFREAWNEVTLEIKNALSMNDTINATFFPKIQRLLIAHLKARRDPAVLRAAARQFAAMLDQYVKAVLDDGIEVCTRQMAEPVVNEDTEVAAKCRARLELVRDWAYGRPSRRRRVRRAGQR